MSVILTRKNLARAVPPPRSGNGHRGGLESGQLPGGPPVLVPVPAGAPQAPGPAAALPPPASASSSPPRTAESVATTPDDTLTRIVKLVPGEVIAGYTALLTITASVTDATDASVKWATPIALAACTIVVALSIRRAGRQHTPPVEPQPAQYLFSILAFWAWALAIRDPLERFGYYIPSWVAAFGCVLVPIFGAYVIDGEAPPAGESS